MFRRDDVECYAVLLAGWYFAILTANIPTLSSGGLLAFTVALVGILAGGTLAASRASAARRRRGAVRLTLVLVAGVLAASLLVSTTGHTIKSAMRATLVGRALVSIVGATLFSGVVLALGTAARTLRERVAAAV